MELIIKVTDCKGNAIDSLSEVAQLIEESRKKNEVLITKGRTKIDMVGETCNVELVIKENKQLSLT